MNSKVMIVLAALMLVGAIVAGYLGYKASAQQAKPVAAVVDAGKAVVADSNHPVASDGRYAVVVAAHDIAASAPIKNEDVYLDYLRQAPPGSFGRVESVVGKHAWVNVPAGSVVGDAALQEGGQLSKLIKPGERAIALPVDEVVGAGGLVRPGDFVDVLLYAKDDSNGFQGGRKNDSAQLVLPGLRVLSYGPRVATAPVGTDKPADQQQADQQKSDPSTARTVVVAVAEPDITKLMLASNLGVLRLAVRSTDEVPPAPSLNKDGKPAPTVLPPDERGLIMSAALVPTSAAPAPRVAMREPRQPKAPAEEKSSITVYRGKDVQQVTP